MTNQRITCLARKIRGDSLPNLWEDMEAER